MKILLPLIPILLLTACEQRSINGDDIANGTYTGPGGTTALPGEDAVYDEYGQLVSINQGTFTSKVQTGNTIRLADYSQEQQKRDREEYARELDVVEANRVVIDSANVPTVNVNVNPAAYARSTTNQLGVKAYARSGGLSGCSKFSSGDAAQRAFLEKGGPASDPLNLDKDGDGFACKFNPNIYRSLSY